MTSFRHILLATAISLAGMTSQPGLAGSVYKFSDGNGNVLFTNVVNSQKKPAGDDLAEFNTLELITWFPDTNVHNYNNWGDDESAVLPSYSKLRDTFDPLIKLEADRYKVERGLVKAVIHTESGFNPKALSKPGAQGLMQLMPATAKRYNVTDPFDPAQNVRAGTEHLKYLLDRYDQIELALA
ncbi:MAG: lytic transglycosylase domain-containing protein, partial [Porticoccaceae bacterium]|nr:lytic transglycosylase domain-containing protein [Porticoccaceae bacterium]